MVDSIITFESGQFSRRAFETKRITDAVAGNARGKTALLGSIDGRRDVDAETKVGVLHGFYEILGGDAIIEHGGHRGGTGEPVDDGLQNRRRITPPVRGRIHIFAWTESAAVDRVAQVDRLKRKCQLEESLELRQRVPIVAAFTAHGKDNVIVAETLRRSEAM